MTITCQRVVALTLLAVLMQSIGLFMFVIGFFPVKPALTGVSGVESYEPGCVTTENEEVHGIPPDRLRSLYEEKSGLPIQFDRIIFMVIDGLPAEFVLGKGRFPPSETMVEAMPYTQSLLHNGRAFGYHAKAAPPTVTMPRLKAMTSGAIAGFLDVAFNFNTQALLDDNLLGQLGRAGWQMVMLGDETWLRLFPSLFIRQDGVSSFYVKDTIEVDRNVSRHLEDELAATDWNLLILHYLGLDHVGHIGGRASPLMAPKLQEMDNVIEKLYTSLVLNNSSGQRTLLVVVSDHGMTDGGNHGGSSFEEVDALALFIAVDGALNTDVASAPLHSAFQVDIVPTLALLLGVPIPKNNVGVVLPQLFHSFTDEQRLRAMELNAWQLLRLLKARLPSSSCIVSICNKEIHDKMLESEIGTLRSDAKLCYLFGKAASLHISWKLQHRSRGIGDPIKHVENSQIAMEAYTEFLRAASEWLARGATEKPLHLLAMGGFLMIGSLLTLFWISFQVCKAIGEISECVALRVEGVSHTVHLESGIACAGICIHALSLGASSLVEEEQYTWHFLLSTLCLAFIHRTCQIWSSSPKQKFKLFFWSQDLSKARENFSFQSPCGELNNLNSISRLSYKSGASILSHQINALQISAVLIVLIAGRLLRAWHQGGVNWAYLPDIAKWLDNTGPHVIKCFQTASVFLVMFIAVGAFLAVKPRKRFQVFIVTNILMSGFLILIYILWCQNQIMPLMDYWVTLLARLVYVSLGLTALTTLLAFPWTINLPEKKNRTDSKSQVGKLHLEEGTRSCIYFAGKVYILCWCLLQLLLQQPVNAGPVVLLLVQILAMTSYFYNAGTQHKGWIMVVTMHWLGMSGHFGLGNSNTLATVDVAGAYTGLSSHSTVLSGILAFIITYASPLLFLLALLLCSSFKECSNFMHAIKDEENSGYFFLQIIALPCVLPLALNSVVLVGFTGILLTMKNHLFVWSVFSPKYLYVCATTACMYIGTSLIAITGFYSSLVIFIRSQ
eukprot:Gb_02601 [translate_table: standard]